MDRDEYYNLPRDDDLEMLDYHKEVHEQDPPHSIAFIKQMMPNWKPDYKVLVCGTGNARVEVNVLSQFWWDIHAVEPVESMLEYAKARMKVDGDGYTHTYNCTL